MLQKNFGSEVTEGLQCSPTPDIYILSVKGVTILLTGRSLKKHYHFFLMPNSLFNRRFSVLKISMSATRRTLLLSLLPLCADDTSDSDGCNDCGNGHD